MKELQTVEDSLVKSLCTFYHGRVSYPKGPSGKEEVRAEQVNRLQAEAPSESQQAAAEDEVGAKEQRRPA
jgi:hypothetical protein